MNEVSLTGTVYPHCTDNLTCGYCLSARILRVCLKSTDDIPQVLNTSGILWIHLMGTDDLPHGYLISTWVLGISFTCNDGLPHGY